MMSSYSVIVHPIASNQFESHIEFLAQVSIKLANDIIDEFEKLEKALAANPTSFPMFYKNYRKAIIKPRYAVLFEIVGSDVFVDKILDMRQSEYNNIVLEQNDEPVSDGISPEDTE